MLEVKINICGEYDATFSDKYGLDCHVSRKHGEVKKCDLCEYKAQDGKTMIDHKISRHEGKSIILNNVIANLNKEEIGDVI